MIFACGDVHGQIDIYKLYPEQWPLGETLTKNDYLVICGDFGLVWTGSRDEEEARLVSWYEQRPWTTLFIDGNHENFDRLFSNEFPEVPMFESTVKQISDSIFHLQRGRIYTIEGKAFLAFGGGESIDKYQRTIGISWWEQEMPTHKEFDMAIGALENVGNKVDFVITHACSSEAFEKIYRLKDLSYRRNADKSLQAFFSWVEANIQFKEWHFGHYHLDAELGKHFAHYNKPPRRIV